jgi:hypothetical protein
MKRLLSVLYLCLLFPANAHAYSDPGSGIMLWQLTVSFFIGLLFYCRRILAFFTRWLRKDEE